MTALAADYSTVQLLAGLQAISLSVGAWLPACLQVTALAVDYGTVQLFTGSQDGTMKVWSCETGQVSQGRGLRRCGWAANLNRVVELGRSPQGLLERKGDVQQFL